MTNSDWSPNPAMTSMEPSSDLFDGDILGDELIDIYNAAVVGGGGDDDDAMNEIPTLLAPSTDLKEDIAMNHPGAAVATAAAAIDDGLGAFRPSTSFNDLSTLPQPPGSTADQNKTKSGGADAPVPVSAPTQTTVVALEPKPTVPPLAPILSQGPVQPLAAPLNAASSQPKTKKRKDPTAPTDAPAPKRKSTSKKGAGNAKSKGKKEGGSNKAQGPKQTKSTKQNKNNTTDGTPNPLIPGQAQQPTVKTSQPIKAIVKPEVQASSTAAPSTSVVTPRVQAVSAPPKEEDAAPATVASSSAATSQPTEADFQSVAQAAVSNLILNAGNGASEASKETTGTKVDTSSDHIKALTGSNWVAVCSGGDLGAQAPASPSDKMNNRARRQNLTADERARQNRDRNREHARNTRLRKKAYVEELKRTLTALVAQRDAADLEKRHSTQRELEQREVRFRVVEEFLKLRGRNEANFARWAAILEESFRFVLPVTAFREMVPSKVKAAKGSHQQILTGVSEAVADSGLFSTFLKSLSKTSGTDPIFFQYQCDRKNFFMDNCTAVLDWTASSEGAIRRVSSGKNLFSKTNAASLPYLTNTILEFLHFPGSYQ